MRIFSSFAEPARNGCARGCGSPDVERAEVPLGAGDGNDFEGRTKPPEFEVSAISKSVSELSQALFEVSLHHQVSVEVIESMQCRGRSTRVVSRTKDDVNSRPPELYKP